MKDTIVGLLMFAGIAVWGVFGLITDSSQSTPQPLTDTEVTSWETDTSSDQPSYYVDTEYTDVNGTSDCTEDCSGHSAGWDYAQENEICDTEYDGGYSESFAEGVRQWAEENCY